VLKALKRLPPQDSYDRVYRIRRAFQCSVTHKLLPKDQWTKPEEVSLSRVWPHTLGDCKSRDVWGPFMRKDDKPTVTDLE
jgi:hypothetical protein